MGKKEVNTPSYWEEEKYQPLTEVETIFGNPIEIPKPLKDSWDFQLNMWKGIISRQGMKDGLQTIREMVKYEISQRCKECGDFSLTMLEEYQEHN